jgi:hypothetical protein
MATKPACEIRTLPKKAWWGNSNQGAIEAVGDLVELSKCDIVLGSHWSQYSELAGELTGKKVIQIGTDKAEAQLKAELERLLK